ncbi:MAG TPA: hypothetical protein VFP84_04620 [Kofleriaceae bacterium]|nr:hypothetical protein [Kofleriaceae bacterium]
MAEFRFRPRYKGIAFGSIGLGGAIAGVAALVGFATLPLATGVLGVALGAAYLASPTWKIAVTADDTGLTVASPRRTRFHLPWNEIVRVVASPTTHTCFVDGGTPEKSLLVPGDGAPAPYDIADRKALVAIILARVPADRIKTVSSLDAEDATAVIPTTSA